MSPNKMPTDASNDDESQAWQLRKATEVLANISVSQRNCAASSSQDSEPITRGQQVRESGSQSQTPQKATEQGISNLKITLTEIDDQMQMTQRIRLWRSLFSPRRKPSLTYASKGRKNT